MFTGIIDEVGIVTELKHGAGALGAARLTISAPKSLAKDSRPENGESIAVNGVCLTALSINAKTFSADVSPETLERSNLGGLSAGSEVNIERCATLATRLSGHIVQGHVDGVGKIVALDALPDGHHWLSVDVPKELARYIVLKGSIALNGISLTVARWEGRRVSATIIPHCFQNTTLRHSRPGALINIECDVLAKYFDQLMEGFAARSLPRKKHKKKALRSR